MALPLISTEAQGLIPLCENLDIVVFTLVRGFQTEVGEVEPDAVSCWGADIPHSELVVGVRLREAWRTEASVQTGQLLAHTRTKQGE